MRVHVHVAANPREIGFVAVLEQMDSFLQGAQHRKIRDFQPVQVFDPDAGQLLAIAINHAATNPAGSLRIF